MRLLRELERVKAGLGKDLEQVSEGFYTLCVKGARGGEGSEGEGSRWGPKGMEWDTEGGRVWSGAKSYFIIWLLLQWCTARL